MSDEKLTAEAQGDFHEYRLTFEDVQRARDGSEFRATVERYLDQQTAIATAGLSEALETSRELNRLKDKQITDLRAENTQHCHNFQAVAEALGILGELPTPEKVTAECARLRSEVSRLQSELNRVVAASVPREVWQAECDGHTATAKSCAELEKQREADGRRIAELERAVLETRHAWSTGLIYTGQPVVLPIAAQQADALGVKTEGEIAQLQSVASERGGGG
jgi:hypothetical protein